MDLQFKTIRSFDSGAIGSPYMTRLLVGRLRLHIFHRGDEDRDPHDHPWGFWTFPLMSYLEEVTVPDPLSPIVDDYRSYQQVVRALRIQYRPASHTHRVVGRARLVGGQWVASPGRIVTIVWREKKTRPAWGFLKNRDGHWCWQEWKAYKLLGGKNTPCE